MNEGPVFPNRFPAGTVANYLAENNSVASNISTGAWRAPRSNFVAGAEQSFIDEVAEAAGKDPIDFRLALFDKAINNPVGEDNDYDPERYAGVLKLVKEKCGWGQDLPGVYRGVSAYYCHNSYVAQVVDVVKADVAREPLHHPVEPHVARRFQRCPVVLPCLRSHDMHALEAVLRKEKIAAERRGDRGSVDPKRRDPGPEVVEQRLRALDAVGAVPAFKMALRCIAPGGRVGVLGVYGAERAEVLTDISNRIKEQGKELAETEAQDSGGLIMRTFSDVFMGAKFLRSMANYVRFRRADGSTGAGLLEGERHDRARRALKHGRILRRRPARAKFAGGQTSSTPR